MRENDQINLVMLTQFKKGMMTIILVNYLKSKLTLQSKQILQTCNFLSCLMQIFALTRSYQWITRVNRAIHARYSNGICLHSSYLYQIISNFVILQIQETWLIIQVITTAPLYKIIKLQTCKTNVNDYFLCLATYLSLFLSINRVITKEGRIMKRLIKI